MNEEVKSKIDKAICNKEESVTVMLHISPSSLEVDLDDLEEAISDKISEETEFCHGGFDYTIVVTTTLDLTE